MWKVDFLVPDETGNLCAFLLELEATTFSCCWGCWQPCMNLGCQKILFLPPATVVSRNLTCESNTSSWVLRKPLTYELSLIILGKTSNSRTNEKECSMISGIYCNEWDISGHCRGLHSPHILMAAVVAVRPSLLGISHCNIYGYWQQYSRQQIFI